MTKRTWTVAGIALALAGCGDFKYPPPAVVQVSAPSPPTTSPREPSIFESSVGKGACVTIMLDHGIPSGFICGTLTEVRSDGIVVSAIDRKNAYGIEPGLNVVLPIGIVKFVAVRP
jgi:hypothetical protein